MKLKFILISDIPKDSSSSWELLFNSPVLNDLLNNDVSEIIKNDLPNCKFKTDVSSRIYKDCIIHNVIIDVEELHYELNKIYLTLCKIQKVFDEYFNCCFIQINC